MPGSNPLSMPDDEFLKMSFPEPPAQEEDAGEVIEDDDNTSIEGDGTDPDPEDTQGEEGTEEGEGSKDVAEGDTPDDPAADEDAGNKPEGAEPDTEKTKEETPPADAEGVPSDVETLQGFWKQIMAPFKANGKTIQVRDPAEAIQLMQMGANYTWKMQSIQPHRKMLMMLENNGLLDEGKLSFLIDLDKRDPEAIKKLIKDSEIDVMDIDTETEPAYQAGNHQVTDQDVAFHETLQELTSSEQGKETVRTIHDTWDSTSKDFLWDHPEIMKIMHQQRESGVYATITAEIDRRITLGQIAPGTPFLQSYKDIGDQLYPQAPASPAQTQQPARSPVPAKVGERAAVPKPSVANGDKVGAAAPAKITPKKQLPAINPLAMNDDEFMKQWAGRL